MRVQHEVTNALGEVVHEYYDAYVVRSEGNTFIWNKSECVDVTHIPEAVKDSLHPEGF